MLAFVGAFKGMFNTFIIYLGSKESNCYVIETTSEGFIRGVRKWNWRTAKDEFFNSHYERVNIDESIVNRYRLLIIDLCKMVNNVNFNIVN